MRNKYLHMLSGLVKHKYYVFVAGLRLKVNIWQLIVHDLDKLLPTEFIGYSYAFNDERPDLADMAWLTHQNKSKHHWEYWILRSSHKKGSGNLVLDMPEKYIREMIADWLGAEKIYGGTWDMTKWLDKNLDKMILSDNTRSRVLKILKEYNLYGNS